MTKRNRERVLDYLRSMFPKGATNSEIREATGIEPHQQVFQLTSRLRQAGLIKGVQGARGGNEWVFWADEAVDARPTPSGLTAPVEACPQTSKGFTPRAFEELARSVMSMHFGVPLMSGEVPGVPKVFDLVSSDRNIVGDAKCLTLVRGKRLPPAKFSNIAEHIWLLEKTRAPVAFLVFGNEQQVPSMWLQRYGHLVPRIAFYFLTDGGELEQLAGPIWRR